jgi:site-specific recombinase XerD
MGKSMLISEAFDLFKRDVILFRGLSAKTHESYVYAAHSLINYLGDIPFTDLTFDLVREWKFATETRVAPNTARNYICCLRQVLRYCGSQGIVCISPDQLPVPKKKATRIEYLSGTEITELIRSVGPRPGQSPGTLYRGQLMIALLYSTGLRVSELCSIDKFQVREDTFTVIGKGDETRPVFIDARSRDLINKYLATRTDSNRALFVGQGGKRSTPSDVRKLFARLREQTRFNFVHPHTIRHSFATNLMENGCHIFPLSRIMGHKSIATTSIYLHVKDPELKEIHRQFHTV